MSSKVSTGSCISGQAKQKEGWDLTKMQWICIRRKARDNTVFSTSVPEVSHMWCNSAPTDAEITGSICGDPERAKGRN